MFYTNNCLYKTYSLDSDPALCGRQKNPMLMVIDHPAVTEDGVPALGVSLFTNRTVRAAGAKKASPTKTWQIVKGTITTASTAIITKLRVDGRKRRPPKNQVIFVFSHK